MHFLAHAPYHHHATLSTTFYSSTSPYNSEVFTRPPLPSVSFYCTPNIHLPIPTQHSSTTSNSSTPHLPTNLPPVLIHKSVIIHPYPFTSYSCTTTTNPPLTIHPFLFIQFSYLLPNSHWYVPPPTDTTYRHLSPPPIQPSLRHQSTPRCSNRLLLYV